MANYYLPKSIKKLNIPKTISGLILFILIAVNALSQGTLTPVSSFGTNPGNLNMYYYAPSGITQSVALVVAMHGCTQTASTFSTQSGWNKLANRHKFIVVYPEQVTANNSSQCFNWFDATDQSKGQGEDLSIKQMVDYMKSHFAIDTTKIFVTGLSAGAGMTTVMLATYPQIFNKGAIMAGLPYQAATSSTTAFGAMSGSVTKTPAQWSALVKAENPSYLGPFPHVAIFHGTSDATVNIANATELIKQWTELNHADQTADATNNSFQGNTSVQQTIYNDSSSNPVVYYYKITGMSHGISLDTGACPRKGGATGTYAIEEHFHSTYWAAYFFGILINPYSISGAIQVTENATNVTYSVVNSTGSTYTWTVPPGATIVSGQGTNSIVVNFGTSSGNITVQETINGGCVNDVASLYVVVNYNVVVSQTANIICHGSATAALSVTATGGTQPYTYSWSPNGGTGLTASGLTPGVYTVIVTDHASVVVTSASFTVTQPAIISANQTIALCAGQTITIGSHVYNTSNTYKDTLAASNGCDSVLTTSLTVHPLSSVSLSIAGNDSLCSYVGTFALSGGSPSGGVYSGSGSSSGNFNPASANIGWNIITYTVTDINNCINKAKDSLYVTTCTTTGIASFDNSKNSTVYPNPATDAVMITTNDISGFKVEVYNSLGTLLLIKEFNTPIAKLDIHTLHSGLYMLNVKTQHGMITQRVMKQ